jgi:hypothetical protein
MASDRVRSIAGQHDREAVVSTEPERKTIPIDGLEAHDYADIFPLLKEDSLAFKALVDDIKANGLKEKVVIYQGKILDGRNRVAALKKLGTTELKQYGQYSEHYGGEPLSFVLSANLHRRHLTTSQRSAIAAKLANYEVGDNQHTGKRKGVSIDTASQMLSVSRISVFRAKAVLENDPKLLEAVERGEITLNAAQQQTTQQTEPETTTQAATTTETTTTTPSTPTTPKPGGRRGAASVVVEEEKKTKRSYLNRLEELVEALHN